MLNRYSKVLQKVKSLPFKQDVVTRWKSKLAMIERLIQQKVYVLTALKLHKHYLRLPTKAEWLQQLLTPCKAVSDTCGGDHYVSSLVVLPALHNLGKIMTPTDDDPQCAERLKNVFKEEIAAESARILTPE